MSAPTIQNLPPAPPAEVRSPARVIGGGALLLVGMALMAYGIHFVVRTGTCSSTGYTEYGPVPKCGGSEALYIMSAFFVGPVLAVLGWLIARAWGLFWPAMCISLGVAIFTIRFDMTVALGGRAFATLVGVGFFGLAALSIFLSARKRASKRALR